MRYTFNSKRRRLSSFMSPIIYLIFIVLIVPAIAYGGFNLYRWFNWKFGYEDKVKEAIIEMVKPECLLKKNSEK